MWPRCIYTGAACTAPVAFAGLTVRAAWQCRASAQESFGQSCADKMSSWPHLKT